MTRRAFYVLAGLASLLLAPRFAVAQTDKPVDVTGDWERTVETPGGAFTQTMKLERKGDVLTGRSINRTGTETKLNNLKLTGNNISFDQDVTYQGMDLHLVYTGTVAGDTMKGTFTTGGQSLDWSAKRLAATAATTAPAASVGAAGTWKITVQGPNGPSERTLIVKQEGEKLTGTVTGPMDRVIPLEDVAFKGQELRFTISFDRNGQTVKRTYVATLNGDSLKGTIEGGNQAREFTGKRESAPAAAATTGLAGAWKLTVQAPDNTYHPTITLVQEAGKWGGKFRVDEQANGETLKDVVVKDNQISFAVDLNFNNMDLHLKFSGTLDGDKLTGTMKAGDGDGMPTTGERQAKA